MYTYTNKLYLKRAFVNKQDIINHTQTKRIIHVFRWYNQGVITLSSDNDSVGDFWLVCKILISKYELEVECLQQLNISLKIS